MHPTDPTLWLTLHELNEQCAAVAHSDVACLSLFLNPLFSQLNNMCPLVHHPCNFFFQEVSFCLDSSLFLIKPLGCAALHAGNSKARRGQFKLI